MNEQIRQLFEQHTVPNFSVGDNLNLSKNTSGEYIDPILEDHWQTFQEAVELTVAECCQVLNKEIIRHDGYGYNQHALYQILRKHFGVKE